MFNFNKALTAGYLYKKLDVILDVFMLKVQCGKDHYGAVLFSADSSFSNV